MGGEIDSDSGCGFKFDPTNPIHCFAGEVVEEMKKHSELREGEYGIVLTLTIILMIISITINIVKFIYDCRHPKDIAGICRTPGLFEQVTVRRFVKRGMSRDQFDIYGKLAIDSIFKVASEWKTENIQKVYDKVRENKEN